MKALIDSLSEEAKKRFSVEIRTYQSIPQYHGIIINNHRLFLGRTDWIFDHEKPELTVGENRYRYFDSKTRIGDERGKERIDLFLHWHKFYWACYSKPVLVFKNGNWELRIEN